MYQCQRINITILRISIYQYSVQYSMHIYSLPTTFHDVASCLILAKQLVTRQD